MRILRLLLLLLLASPVSQATFYFVGTSCPGGAGATFSLWSIQNSSWIFQNVAWPFSYGGSGYQQYRVHCPSGVSPTTVTAYPTSNPTGDQTCDVCSGVWTAGAPPDYSGPYKLCGAIVNESTVARNYAIAGWSGTNWTPVTISGRSVFPLAPGDSTYYTLTASTNTSRFNAVVGRYERQLDGQMKFTRLGGALGNGVYWVATASNCVPFTITDKGGVVAGLPDQDAVDIAANGLTNTLQQARTNRFDTSSKTNSRIDYATATGGALTQSDFKTGVASLKTGLDDISEALEKLRAGQTNASDSSPDMSHINSSTITGNATAGLSSIATAQAGFGTSMGALGGTSGGSAYGTRTTDAWNISVAGTSMNINPLAYSSAWSGVGTWSRWIMSWLMTIGLLFHVWQVTDEKMRFIGPVQSMKSHLTGVFSIAGAALATLMATAIIVASIAIPVLFWTIFATSGMFTAIFESPLTHIATGDSGIWVARWLDFILLFVPLDVALGHLIHYVGWRCAFDIVSKFAWAVTKYCVG